MNNAARTLHGLNLSPPGRMSDAPADPQPSPLSCMEIWGGNETFDSAVTVPGIDAWVYSRPHGPASSSGGGGGGASGGGGGDVHYVSMCACGEIGRFFLADISGHGPGASKPAVEVRRLMRKYINTVDQTDFVRSLNDHVMQWSAEGRFATAVLTTYFAPTHEFLICNAGHPPPLWYRADRDAWEWLVPDVARELTGVSNLPVGIVEGTQYTQFVVKLGVGDRVILYSDGIYEVRDEGGTQLGREGLRELAASFNDREPHEQVRSIVEATTARRGVEELDDDLTLMLLHHHGNGRIEQTFGDRLRTMGKMLGLLRV